MNNAEDSAKIQRRIKRQKKAVLKALNATAGIVYSACREAKISRQTYYRWYDEDPEFREKADDVKEQQKDFAESLILKKMKQGDTKMLIFYAKTQMKDRGFTERQELTGKDGDDLVPEEFDFSTLTDAQRALLEQIGKQLVNKKE